MGRKLYSDLSMSACQLFLFDLVLFDIMRLIKMERERVAPTTGTMVGNLIAKISPEMVNSRDKAWKAEEDDR